MMSTLLSLGQPANVFQFVYMMYLYGLPLLLWAVFAWCVISDQDAQSRAGSAPRAAPLLVALLVPLIGAVAVLLGTARLRRTYGLIVLVGLLAFLLPLAAGLWLAGGPLGPKALG